MLMPYKFTSKSEVFSNWAPLPNPKEMKASLSKLQALKFILQNADSKLRFSKLQILSSKSNFRSSFANLFNFKFSKTCWKVRKYIKEVWLILKKWVSRVDFERFFLKCFASWNELKQTLFIRQARWRLIKLRKREFDRLERIWQFYQPSSCLSKKKRLFLPILHFFLKQKTLKVNASNWFFQNESNFFYKNVDFSSSFWELEVEQVGKRRAEIRFRR